MNSNFKQEEVKISDQKIAFNVNENTPQNFPKVNFFQNYPILSNQNFHIYNHCLQNQILVRTFLPQYMPRNIQNPIRINFFSSIQEQTNPFFMYYH